MKFTKHPLCHPAGMTLVEVLVSMAIATMTIAGIISGYYCCTKAVVKAELQQAASAKAMERLEVTRSAVWAPQRSTPKDDLVITNFPDLTVSLDVVGTNAAGTMATVRTTIAPISASPPMRLVHVDCIWQFQGGQWITNSVECIRAGDQ
jgi:Tfp pilus assembly protein PilV